MIRGCGGDVIVVGVFPASESESEFDLAAAEIMVVWAIQGPNALVSKSSLELRLDARGHSLSILQSPCSLNYISCEEAVHHLVKTSATLRRSNHNLPSRKLRNDAVLEYFLESALKDFAIGCVEQTKWHPDYRSHRVVLYGLEKKSKRCLGDDSSLKSILLAI